MRETPHVRSLIMSTRGLPATAKFILAEVCAMCEHGARKCFDANNRKLAEAAGVSIPKVSAHLAMLKAAGFITFPDGKPGERRVILPTESWATHYRNDKLDTLTELIRGMYRAYQNDKGGLIKSVTPPLTESVRNPYQFDNHNSIEGQKEKEQKGIAACSDCLEHISAIAALEIKLANALAKIENAKVAYRELRTENEALKTQAAKPAKSKRAPKVDELAGKGKIITDIYRHWYLAANNAEAARQDAADNVAARTIYQNLLLQPECDNDESVGNLFSALLQNWPRLEPFLQRQQKLSQISSNLTNILPQLIHHGTTKQLSTPGLIDSRKRNDAFAFLKEFGI